jgi:RimJ/RimL family protein N-acetyltransferase
MYKCLFKNKFQSGNYSVLPMREEDIYLIKNWRNEQMDILRQKNVLTDEDQKKYYKRYVLPGFSEQVPRIMLFSYLLEGQCIGYGGLTNIDWESKRIELSFLINTNRKNDESLYRSDFGIFIELMKEIVFKELNFNRIFTETYDIRPVHISILENSGFKLEGRLKEHVMINGGFVDSLIHGFIKEYYNV